METSVCVERITRNLYLKSQLHSWTVRRVMPRLSKFTRSRDAKSATTSQLDPYYEIAIENGIIHQHVSAVIELLLRITLAVEEQPERVWDRGPVQLEYGIVRDTLNPPSGSKQAIKVQLPLDDDPFAVLVHVNVDSPGSGTGLAASFRSAWVSGHAVLT